MKDMRPGGSHSRQRSKGTQTIVCGQGMTETCGFSHISFLKKM